MMMICITLKHVPRWNEDINRPRHLHTISMGPEY